MNYFIFSGLVKGNLSATIGGGIVLGVSAVFSVILALVFVYCLKNNDVDSNVNEQRSLPHQQNRHQKQHRQINREQTSSREITVVSEIHKYDNQKQYSPNGYSLNQLSPSVQSIGLTHSTNSGFGRQLPQSPSKTSSFYFNQNNGSMVNQNQQANIKRNNYNRH